MPGNVPMVGSGHLEEGVHPGRGREELTEEGTLESGPFGTNWSGGKQGRGPLRRHHNNPSSKW